MAIEGVRDRELDVPGRQRRYPQTPHHHRHHRGFEGENKDQDRGVIRSSPPESLAPPERLPPYFPRKGNTASAGDLAHFKGCPCPLFHFRIIVAFGLA
ncbi:MAG: hypothetical protein FRX48_02390 [Lasallia pustulata]|uniref:Uncharacterized protein n=1 Tax=Lasallia pustulata TaxID=136370 RepID=A0A5M8PZC9_9LECA|nr:MAG: hypothetical protein FRX48_02390 [Lasallia pustulata]